METILEALQNLGARVFFAFWLPIGVWSAFAWIIDRALLRVHDPHHILALRLAIFWSLPFGLIWANWGWLPIWEVKASSGLVGFELLQSAFGVSETSATAQILTARLLYAIPLVLWVLVVLRGLRLGGGLRASWHNLQALRTLLSPVNTPEFIAEVQNLSTRMGIRRSVRLFSAPMSFSPFTFGILNPVLVLPSALLPPSHARTVAIHHELVHIRRMDVLWRFLEECLLLVTGWHPLAHHYHHEILFAREATCDAEVLSGSEVSRQTYAQLLYKLLASESERTNPLLSAMASPQFHQLKRRVQTMKKQTYSYRRFHLWWSLLLLVFATGLTAATGFFDRPIMMIKPDNTLMASRDTVKTLIVERKTKTIQTISVHPKNTKPIRVTFTDKTFLDMTSDEALAKGIIPPPPPPPPPPSAKWVERKLDHNTTNLEDYKPQLNTMPGQDGVWTFVEVQPQFPGGPAGLNAYLSGNLKYPELAQRTGIEGDVFIQFVVNDEGRIVDASVVRSIGGGCDEEALRLVKEMPHWTPGMHQGKPVKVRYTVKVRFKLA